MASWMIEMASPIGSRSNCISINIVMLRFQRRRAIH
jgi:hypothetical protein